MLPSLGKFSEGSRLRMILVTGATGKTGRALVQRLVSRSMPVSCEEQKGDDGEYRVERYC